MPCYGVVPEHHRRGVPNRNVVVCVGLRVLRLVAADGQLAQERIRAFARAQRRSVVASFDPIVCGHVREVFGLRGEGRGVETLRAWQRRRSIRREIVEMNAKVIRHDTRRIVVQHACDQLQCFQRVLLRERSMLPGQAAVLEKGFGRQELRIFVVRRLGECEHCAPIGSVVVRPACKRAVIAQPHDRDESPFAFRQGAVERDRFSDCARGNVESIFGWRSI